MTPLFNEQLSYVHIYSGPCTIHPGRIFDTDPSKLSPSSDNPIKTKEVAVDTKCNNRKKRYGNERASLN